MKTIFLIASLCIGLVHTLGVWAADTKLARINNSNTGDFTLQYPADWRSIERRNPNFDTTFYRLIPADQQFNFEMMINNKDVMRMGDLNLENLERYLIFNMSGGAQSSVEKEIKPLRFGKKNDGAYALITDAYPKPNGFLYWVMGVRLVQNNVIVFNVYSNDKSSIQQILPVVESVSFIDKP